MCCPYGWVFDPKLSEQRSLLGRLSLDGVATFSPWVGLDKIRKKQVKMDSLPPKFIIKVGTNASFGN